MTPSFAHVFTAAFMCEPRKGVGPSNRCPSPHSSLSRLFTNPDLGLCDVDTHVFLSPSICVGVNLERGYVVHLSWFVTCVPPNSRACAGCHLRR